MRKLLLVALALSICALSCRVCHAQDDEWHRAQDEYRYIKKKKFAAFFAAHTGQWFENQAVGFGLGNASPCTSATTTTCTWNFLPTVANSGIAVGIVTSNNVTVSGTVTWSCGGTWTVQTGTKNFDSAVGNIEVITNTGNTGGCTSATFTVSGAPGNSIWNGIVPNVVEFPPPASGATVSVDQVSTIDDSTNCSTCTLAPFNSANSNALTATDAVVQFNVAAATMTSCVLSSPTSSGCFGTYTGGYLDDYNGDAVYVNAPSGGLTGTALQRNGSGPVSGHVVFSAIAFKSSLGNFTASPVAIWTPTNSNTFVEVQQTCSPACPAIPISSTAGGDLLLLCSQTGGGSATEYIASVSDNKSETWTNLGSFRIGVTGLGTTDCWFVDSDTAGVTSITPTMNATDTAYYFSVYEINKSTGTASLDAQASTNNSTASATPLGQALTLTGSNDFCIQGIQMPGATSGILAVSGGYSEPWNAWTNTNGQNISATNSAGAIGLAFNVSSVPAPTWMTYNSVSAASLVGAACWK